MEPSTTYESTYCNVHGIYGINGIAKCAGFANIRSIWQHFYSSVAPPSDCGTVAANQNAGSTASAAVAATKREERERERERDRERHRERERERKRGGRAETYDLDQLK
jgi:hypothetical protein